VGLCKLEPGVRLTGVLAGKRTQSGLVHFKLAAAKTVRVDEIPVGKRLRFGTELAAVKTGDRVVDITPVIDGVTYWAKAESAAKKRGGKSEPEPAQLLEEKQVQAALPGMGEPAAAPPARPAGKRKPAPADAGAAQAVSPARRGAKAAVPLQPTLATVGPAPAKPKAARAKAKPISTAIEPAAVKPGSGATGAKPATVASKPATVKPEAVAVKPEPAGVKPEPAPVEPPKLAAKRASAAEPKAVEKPAAAALAAPAGRKTKAGAATAAGADAQPEASAAGAAPARKQGKGQPPVGGAPAPAGGAETGHGWEQVNMPPVSGSESAKKPAAKDVKKPVKK